MIYLKGSRLLAGGFLLLSSVLLAGCFGSSDEMPTSATPVLKKSISTFQNPESVIFDSKRDVFYVSQANFSEASGGGKISILNAAGEITELGWVTGLNHPKGLGIYKDKLYVADVTELVEIDISTGTVKKKYPLKGSIFLNDVTIDKEGTVYVSDTLTNEISRLKPGGEFEVFLSSDKLSSPNGLLIVDDTLYVAAWGQADGKTVEALQNAKPIGRLMKVDIASKRIKVLSKKSVGNLDGLTIDGRGNFYVSDWVAGKLFHMKMDGTIIKTFDMAKILGVESAKGFADIVFLEGSDLIYAPMMLSGSVNIFSVAPVPGDKK